MFTAKSVFILCSMELEHGFDEKTMGEHKTKFTKAIDLLKNKAKSNALELTDEEFKIVDMAYTILKNN